MLALGLAAKKGTRNFKTGGCSQSRTASGERSRA
ncbi:hypothetical protein T09_8719 [Trichinella sp. T9]|nr:hypothetical protein T09_8719 [Trichinella sp. T9]